MAIIRISHSKDYTCISNQAIKDKRLSFKARGLHHLLLSYPDMWEVNTAHLVSQSDKDGRDSINAAIQELKQLGYLARRRFHNSKTGQFDWITELYELPVDQEAIAFDNQAQAINGKTVDGGRNTTNGKAVDGEKLETASILVESPYTGLPLTARPYDGSAIDGKPVHILSTDQSSNERSSTKKERTRDDRCRDRDGDSGKKPSKSKKTARARFTKLKEDFCAAEIYQMLSHLESFEKSWRWYCDKLEAAPCKKDGTKYSHGVKHYAAAAWKVFVEDTNSIDEFRAGLQRHDFRQIGLTHYERFISSETWRSTPDLDLPNDFIQEKASGSAPDDRTRDRWLQEAREKGHEFYKLPDGSLDQTKVTFYRENKELIFGESYAN